MSFKEFDMIRVLLETELLGTTGMLIAFVIFLPTALFMLARIPPFFTFLLMSPMILGIGALIGVSWAGGAIWLVIAIIWLLITRFVLQVT